MTLSTVSSDGRVYRSYILFQIRCRGDGHTDFIDEIVLEMVGITSCCATPGNHKVEQTCYLHLALDSMTEVC